MGAPATRYARSGEVHLAYQTVGDGPIDVLFVPLWWGHIELLWESPLAERFFERLAQFSRLILYDRRGTGLSDPVSLDALPTLEELAADAIAVLDTVGSERAVMLGGFEGGAVAMMVAATHPERAEALVTVDAYARFARAADHPFGMPEDAYRDVLAAMRDAWGTGATVGWLTPSKAEDPSYVDWYARYERHSVSPAVAVAMGEVNYALDARGILSSIRVPALVIHRAGNRWVRLEHGRHLAEHIPGATFVELPGADSTVIGAGQEDILDCIEEFVTGATPVRDVDRVLATIAFTDIVGSTGRAASMGDAAWTDLVARHDAIVRRLLGRYDGHEIKTMGDGFLATFAGPARAIRFATAARDAVRALGIEIRVGLHTGECERVGDDIGGIAVSLAKRVEASARPGEVFVTRTVRDLVAGSGLRFEDEGVTELKGVPEPWQLYRVAD